MADHLVMFSEAKSIKKIQKLSEFAPEKGLKVDSDKTKCMAFNKNGKHIRCSISCGDLLINSTREYKYLGFLVTPSGEVTTGIKDLSQERYMHSYN